MLFLFINNHCITDPTAGVTRSLWTILRWLAEAGHEVRAITTARFESPVPFTIEQHLAGLKGNIRWDHERKSQRSCRPTAADGRRVARFQLEGVAVTLLMTRANDESLIDSHEQRQYLKIFSDACEKFAPEQVIAANDHPMMRLALAEARRRGAQTSFAVRGFGYDAPDYFTDVHRVFTCSEFLTRHFFERTGLSSTPLVPPLDWSQTLSPGGSHKFLTFVNPSPRKGAMWFAGLAKRLGEDRPDIPVLVDPVGPYRSASEQHSRR